MNQPNQLSQAIKSYDDETIVDALNVMARKPYYLRSREELTVRRHLLEEHARRHGDEANDDLMDALESMPGSGELMTAHGVVCKAVSK